MVVKFELFCFYEYEGGKVYYWSEDPGRGSDFDVLWKFTGGSNTL